MRAQTRMATTLKMLSFGFNQPDLLILGQDLNYTDMLASQLKQRMHCLQYPAFKFKK